MAVVGFDAVVYVARVSIGLDLEGVDVSCLLFFERGGKGRKGWLGELTVPCGI